jgi:hypothetical protein
MSDHVRLCRGSVRARPRRKDVPAVKVFFIAVTVVTKRPDGPAVGSLSTRSRERSMSAAFFLRYWSRRFYQARQASARHTIDQHRQFLRCRNPSQ